MELEPYQKYYHAVLGTVFFLKDSPAPRQFNCFVSAYKQSTQVQVPKRSLYVNRQAAIDAFIETLAKED